MMSSNETNLLDTHEEMANNRNVELTRLEQMQQDDSVFSAFWTNRELTLPVDRLKPANPIKGRKTRREGKSGQNGFFTLSRKTSRNSTKKVTEATMKRKTGRSRFSMARTKKRNPHQTKSKLLDVVENEEPQPPKIFRLRETESEIKFRQSLRNHGESNSINVPPPVNLAKEPLKIDHLTRKSTVQKSDVSEDKTLHRETSHSYPVTGSGYLEEDVRPRTLSQPVGENIDEDL